MRFEATGFPPLIYVFIGEQLPRYAFSSLKIASRRYRGRVILLTNFPVQKRLPAKITAVDISIWYDKSRFEHYAENSYLNGFFRNGFWLSAVERFFILEQFAKRHNISKFFHAELDVLILNLEGIDEACDRRARGIFIPAESSRRAIASLIYINDVQALSELCKFFVANAKVGNEMKMLAEFMNHRRDIGLTMPSERIFGNDWPFGLSSVENTGGVVDCSSLGHWLFGHDPRNERGLSMTLYKGTAEFNLSELRFKPNWNGSQISVNSGKTGLVTIHSIHVHSKTFARLRIPGVVPLYCQLANLGIRIPVGLGFDNVRLGFVKRIFGFAESVETIMRSKKARRITLSLLTLFMSLKPSPLSSRQMRVLIKLLSPEKFAGAGNGQLISASARTIAPQAPQSWRSEFSTLTDPEWKKFSSELSIFLFVLSGASKLVSVSPLGVMEDVAGNQSLTPTITPLVVSAQRSDQFKEHSHAMWGGEVGKSRLTFSDNIQHLRADLVREMFPLGSEQVFRWGKLALLQKNPDLSALVSYCEWVSANKHSSMVLLAETSASDFYC